MTHSTIGLPQIRWSTLGSSDRIRVPWPAAMMRTVKGSLIEVRGYTGQGAQDLSSGAADWGVV